MKHLTVSLTAVLLIVSAACFAQQSNANKPKQFQNFSNVITCPESELSRVFAISESQNVTLALGSNFNFAGAVISNVVKYSNLQTVMIRSPFFNNTVFQVSKRTNPDNSITYVGRIINLQYADGYELQQDSNRNYQLVKVETDRVAQTCPGH